MVPRTGNSKIMDILLTGHKGFIGSQLMRELSKDHRIIGIDLEEGQDLLYCEFPNMHFDLIIHLAGKSGVRESITDPASYWMNNVEASRRLFERYPNTRILYASSSSAYEPDLNPYAASKYVLEELAARYPNTLGMRFHTVYSDNCPRENMFFNKLLNNELEYTTRHYRDFVHLYDVIDAIKILIKRSQLNGIIDIGTGNPIKIRDLAPDLPVRLNTPGEREYTCADTDLIKSLGWKPKYTVEKFLTNNNLGNIINLFNGETVE
jgi:nucleoside-diphosphate-sugar epimerase